MGLDPVGLLSLLDEEETPGLSLPTEERPCEDTARRRPSTSQGERSQEEPTLPALWS